MEARPTKMIERCCSKITTVIEAATICRTYTFFDNEKFDKRGREKLIKDACKQYKVDENHIRKILEL